MMKERVRIKNKFLTLYSLVIIPISSPESFLDLQYKKIKPNKVELSKTVSITVDESASPLFYKFDKAISISKIGFSGRVEKKSLKSLHKDDSYFQIGLIYKGKYRPGGFVRAFLPEWLLKVLDLSKKHGVGNIHFYGVVDSEKSKSVNIQKIKSLKLKFNNSILIQKDGSFKAQITLDESQREVLGLWLRSDGDESNAQFKTIIEYLEVN